MYPQIKYIYIYMHVCVYYICTHFFKYNIFKYDIDKKIYIMISANNYILNMFV